jgi:hypothetical protein
MVPTAALSVPRIPDSCNATLGRRLRCVRKGPVREPGGPRVARASGLQRAAMLAIRRGRVRHGCVPT